MPTDRVPSFAQLGAGASLPDTSCDPGPHLIEAHPAKVSGSISPSTVVTRVDVSLEVRETGEDDDFGRKNKARMHIR